MIDQKIKYIYKRENPKKPDSEEPEESEENTKQSC